MLVEWSEAADEDLDLYVEFIRRDSEFYADRFAEKIILTTQRLEEFPESGRIIPECESEVWREVIVGDYRVMYYLEPQRVLIAAVVHASRDLTNPKNQPWETH